MNQSLWRVLQRIAAETMTRIDVEGDVVRIYSHLDGHGRVEVSLPPGALLDLARVRRCAGAVQRLSNRLSGDTPTPDHLQEAYDQTVTALREVERTVDPSTAKGARVVTWMRMHTLKLGAALTQRETP